MEMSGQLHYPAALLAVKSPGAGLDAMVKRKFSSCRESNPRRPARSPSLSRLRKIQMHDKISQTAVIMANEDIHVSEVRNYEYCNPFGLA
jgi:hypothetical protein